MQRTLRYQVQISRKGLSWSSDWEIDLDCIHVKIAILLKATNSLFVHKVEIFVAETTKEEGILWYPCIVHCDPNSNAGLADHAVFGVLAPHAPDHGFVRQSLSPCILH